MPYGDQSITQWFGRKDQRKENHRPVKRKRQGASAPAADAERPVSPPPKKVKQNVARRQVLDDKDGIANKPPPGEKTFPHTNTTPNLPQNVAGPSRRAQILQTPSAAHYPTPKSVVKHIAAREPPTVAPLIDLTEDDDQGHRAPSPPLPPGIHSVLTKQSLITPKTPSRRRHAPSIYEVVPETPDHPSSPIRIRQPETPTRRNPDYSDEGDITTSLEVVPSSQTQEIDATMSQIQDLKRNASRPSIQPLQPTNSEMIVPSSQSQEQEIDEAFMAKWREAHPVLKDDEVVPSSQSQVAFWSRDDNPKDSKNEDSGEEEELDLDPDRTAVPILPSSLQRSDSNVSFIIPIEDNDLSDLFEDGDALWKAQDDAVLPMPSSSQATSATESDSGDEQWLQNVGNRTAVGHAASQKKAVSSPSRSQRKGCTPRRSPRKGLSSPSRSRRGQHSSPSRSQRRKVDGQGQGLERTETTRLPSRSATPEWPSQLTLSGLDVDSSQWSFGQAAGDFLDMESMGSL
ncbi:hypothetical protein AAF712_010024 [Marasmius tenuissimus]|uniref:Uncharacterized protein n=1 Tax=Marasmius tenuissimus TaxID=585030 RepID=A0ABR2ZNG9_9AGAR